MGLNYVPRPPREQLDPPNDFVSGALGDVDVRWAHDWLTDTVLEFEDEILTRIQRQMSRVGYGVKDPA